MKYVDWMPATDPPACDWGSSMRVLVVQRGVVLDAWWLNQVRQEDDADEPLSGFYAENGPIDGVEKWAETKGDHR